ncbi:hypothetical protein CHUAL_006023 [Chamberlinius hualienensis]
MLALKLFGYKSHNLLLNRINKSLNVCKCLTGIRPTLIRYNSSNQPRSEFNKGKSSTLYYVSGVAVLVLGLSYAAVPLYRLYCQATSYGGQLKAGHDDSKVEGMKKVSHRLIQVSPGETALAFYTATNPTDRGITGIATYNVIPFEAGQYFNKIQCFCFEEQRLNPHEQVDMPVFFYLDPDYAEDPKLETIDSITLSYTFFEAKEGFVLPTPPSYASNRHS